MRWQSVVLAAVTGACAPGYPVDFTVLPPGRMPDARVRAAAHAARAEPGRMPSLDVVAIGASTFDMGCLEGDPACEADEKPAHRVRLPAFRIDRHEVTWERYAACIEAGACDRVSLGRCYVWTSARKFEIGVPLDPAMIAADKPVVCVTWAQAEALCELDGGTLPTEAQWERAARGTRRSMYAWGNTPPSCEHAQYDGCGLETRAVGSLPAGNSPDGVTDLGGNAWEWAADWYDDGTYGRLARRLDPRGPWEGDVRVVRGGSFYDSEVDLRASYRYGLSPEFGYSTVGFRCAYRDG